MDITITFDHDRWSTDPNPAIVRVGTRVRWIFRAPKLRNQRVRWMVDFKNRSPFSAETRLLKIETRNSSLERRVRRGLLKALSGPGDFGLIKDLLIDHLGVSPALAAERPGDYKYDLHVEDAITGKRIGDDDPRLYVVTGIVLPDKTVSF